jgi:hypothetical protein
MKKKKNSANRIAQRIYTEGWLLGLWDSEESAAKLINLERATLGHDIRDTTLEDLIRTRTIGPLQKVLKTKKGELGDQHPTTEAVRKAYLDGIEIGVWKKMSACAAKIGVQRVLLSQCLRHTSKDIRPPSTIDNVLRKIQEKLKDLKGRRKSAHETRGSPIPFGGVEAQVSLWLLSVLAGIADDPTQTTVDAVPFVLTAERFKTWDGKSVNKGAIKDTVALIQELRRRLNIFSEIDSEEKVADIYRTLRPELKELWIAVELLGKQNPDKFIETLQAVREGFKL